MTSLQLAYACNPEHAKSAMMRRVPENHFGVSIEAAEHFLRGKVKHTPVLQSEELDERAGAELFLKAECMQKVGAFKARGALFSLSQLSPGERERGVTTYSSGNHAQAVAWAAAYYGIKATIFMPVDAPVVKVERTRKLGAEIYEVGTTSLQRREAALAFASRSKALIIEPFDHPNTIAGQATATTELLRHVDANGIQLDRLYVPVGGGGLVAGACLACEGTDVEVIGVEPVGCDSMAKSLEAKRIVCVDPVDTIADGLKPSKVGELNLKICMSLGLRCETVTDDELLEAAHALLFDVRVVVEPSAAAPVAAALRAQSGGKSGIILSGGNVAPHMLARMALAAQQMSKPAQG